MDSCGCFIQMAPAANAEQQDSRETAHLALESDAEKVISLLCDTRLSYTAAEIKKECGVDVEGNKELVKRLATDRKVMYAQKLFSYLTKYDDVRNRDQLLRLIQRTRGGIPVVDLIDTYPTAMADLKALRDDGDIWLIVSTDLQGDIAYPRYYQRDPRISVDGWLKELFRSIDVPSDDL